MSGLKPPFKGVHLSCPFEYLELQHPFRHWRLEVHNAHSPRSALLLVGGGTGAEPPQVWPRVQWAVEQPQYPHSEQQVRSAQIPLPTLPPPQKLEFPVGADTGAATGAGAGPLPEIATSAQLINTSGTANGVARSYAPQIGKLFEL